jgi:anaerobic dimethyl sulfoxide reductase subunit A
MTRVHVSKTWDAVLKGKAGGYVNDTRMLYVTCGNPLNQFPDTNCAVRAMEKLEFIVVHEQIMTPTAKFADILLPACTWCERNDINSPYCWGYHVIYANQAIEPLFESRTDLDIFTDLADRMGIEDFNGHSEDEWLRFVSKKIEIPDYESFKNKGVSFFYPDEPHVAFRPQIQDPSNNPFPTPSGKIELCCQELADLDAPDTIPAVPKYIDAWEGANDPLRSRFPLQLITPHSRKRVHSQLHHIPWLPEIDPHSVWINPEDAEARGIADGDEVKVFNERGTTVIPAKVTDRIMPGVVAIYQGAWYDPDENGIDRGGCANVLTKGEHSPLGAFSVNTSLVEVHRT